jgi:long-chain acyl-CoA synthetase
MRKEKLLAHVPTRACLSDGHDTWSLIDLKQAVTSWINKLDELDVRRVAFDLPNGFDWAALDIALLESDRVAIPVPSFFSTAQRSHTLKASGAEVMISLLDSTSKAEAGKLVNFNRFNIERRSDAEDVKLPAGTALVTFTSGSTGQPKGVCLSAQTLLQTANSLHQSLKDQDIQQHLCVLPLTLLLENTAGLFANLLNGSTIYVPDLADIGVQGSSQVDVGQFVKGIETFGPDSIIVVPALLLAITASAEFGLVSFKHFKFVAVGGGRVTPELLHRAAQQNIPVYEGYGLTECGSVITLNTPMAQKVGSVGRLLPHVEASVENEELIVTRPRMLGVIGDLDTCTEVATGDRVAIDVDGYLTVYGRLKNTFITAYGRNVSPEWVESELQTELCISHAAVFGEAAETNTALLLPRGEPTDAELDAAVSAANQRLPDYAQIGPWHRVTAADMNHYNGLTSNGRVRRQAWQELFNFMTQPEQLGASL